MVPSILRSTSTPGLAVWGEILCLFVSIHTELLVRYLAELAVLGVLCLLSEMKCVTDDKHSKIHRSPTQAF